MSTIASTPQLTAGDICTRIVSIAYPALAIEEAARVMRDQHVGSLVVVEEIAQGERRVVGMLTDRDIVTGAVAVQRELPGLRVADLMNKEVVTVREQDSVLDVLATMRRKAVRRVPVVGPHGLLVGVVAIDDILELVAEQMQALASAVSSAQRHEQVMPR
ncbi:CBS domain-containing protein [Ideonella sp.]|uniref:CBS domain-containing protein n=1 Tax=Ideonella sp. TaxID=1929293 RepID=UPI002B4A696A|nr:CBS domain-containing protein [Ideonella sp.]HJV71490.1 CBS domain-containing protein [Ideonella sp.]